MPLNCTRHMKTAHLEVSHGGENCTSVDEVNQFECGGGCGSNMELCCLPAEVEMIYVQYECPSGATIQVIFEPLFLEK